MSRITLRVALVALALSATAFGASEASAFQPFHPGHFGHGPVAGSPVGYPGGWRHGRGFGWRHHGFGWGYLGAGYGVLGYEGCVNRPAIDEDGDVVIRRLCY
jgi:hypothetical protein